MPERKVRSADLPVKRNITLLYVLSLSVAVLSAMASILGLLNSATLYPTDALAQSCIPNDVVNLFIGVPILLISMALAWRGKFLGVLLWPGALLFVAYNSLAYIFLLPLNTAFLLHLLLVVLSSYTTIALVASIDGARVQQRLSGAVPERVSGGVLAGLGSLFGLRAIALIVGAIVSQMPMADAELAVSVADMLTMPAWIIGGLSLWRRRSLGYVAGLGLLFQGSMLFIGLIVLMALQPMLTSASFALVDILIVAVMGMICFVPFGLTLRGVITAARAA